jgi:hypothetical protein
VPKHREAEQAALLLPVDHGDDARTVRVFNRTDRLGALDGIPPPHNQGLKSHDRNKYPKK